MALRYNAPMRQGLRRAGQLFGLSLLDLFADEDTQQGDFDPDLQFQTQKGEQGDFAPSLQFQTTSRGRGAGLTYMPQQRDTVSTTLNLAPIPQAPESNTTNIDNTNNNTNNNTNDDTPPPQQPVTPPTVPLPVAPPPEPEDTRPSLFEIAAKYGQSGLFGHQDYRQATETYGYSNEEVKKHLEDNPYVLHASHRDLNRSDSLLNEVLRGKVDTSRSVSRSDPEGFKTAFSYTGSPQISTRFGQSQEFFGAEDLKAAKQSGYSDEQISDFLNKNQNLLRGENRAGGKNELAQYVTAPREPVTPKGGSSFSAQFGESDEFFGHKDYEAAKAGGASDKEIKAFLDKNLSMLRGRNRPGGGNLYDQISSRAGG